MVCVCFFNCSCKNFEKQKENSKNFSKKFKKFFKKKREKTEKMKKECKKIHKKSALNGLVDMCLNHSIGAYESFSKKMKKY